MPKKPMFAVGDHVIVVDKVIGGSMGNDGESETSCFLYMK